MLGCLQAFRDSIDSVMHKCMDKRIVVYGYGYSGRFVTWYADYYHSIKVDYIITFERSNIIPYEYPLFKESLFDYDYKDIKDAVVWLCTAETDSIKEKLLSKGYEKNKTYFDMNEVVYGENYDRLTSDTNVQFMRFLEREYSCDIIEPIYYNDYDKAMTGAYPSICSTPKEIFPLLDKCHIIPQKGDAIFDFGCGKGSALISFLDYGFTKVAGVEYADHVYDILVSNFKKLGIDLCGENVNCIHGDARLITKELDDYNWFYFFDPFAKDIFEKVIDNICESLDRNPRKAHIININPTNNGYIKNKERFVLTNQFDIMTRNRVVDVFVTK